MSTKPLPIVIGLGELLWDDFPDGKLPGGAPANVAFQTNQLSCHGLVATRVGEDRDGEELCSLLTGKGLDLSIVQRDPAHPTGRVTVQLTAGIPAYEIHENAAWDFLELTDSLQQAMASASAVCFGTLAQRTQQSRETIHAAVSMTRPDCLRVYDVNLRQKFYTPEWVTASLKLATIVKLNDEEVELLAPLLELPQDQLEFARAVIRNYGPQTVCITRGAKGCLVVTETEAHDIPGKAVKVADTVGAGDAFTAGLIASQLQKWPLARSAEFANRVGGMVASRQGAMPELREEFKQLVEQYRPAGSV
ncbi:carbohydrate kinase family protein [Planctomicrobium sp. SH661]|uniref:carbohydrate kinase family protein n=1 Tax=Planctomicrobium sp. SH661 TaxID=3448124 RepID=UPI003F5CB50E